MPVIGETKVLVEHLMASYMIGSSRCFDRNVS